MARDLIGSTAWSRKGHRHRVHRPATREKLHEELITVGEGIVSTGHDKIMVLRGKSRDTAALLAAIERLIVVARQGEADSIKKKLREIVPDYTPPLNPIIRLPETNGPPRARMPFVRNASISGSRGRFLNIPPTEVDGHLCV